MVRHNQFSRQQQQQGQQQQHFMAANGYDLCRFKQDFMDKFKYECNNKALGFSRVKELMQFLMELLAGFAAAQPEAHAALSQEWAASGSRFVALLQQLIADPEQQLPATLTDPAAAQGQQQQQQQHKLWAINPSAADVTFIITLYEHVAAQLMDMRVKAGSSWSSTYQPEVSLYDIGSYIPGSRSGTGLAAAVLKAWPQLSLQSLQELKVAGSLEELLGCEALFGRLLSLKRHSSAGGSPARVGVCLRFNARADLVRLLERRMLQLTGAGLRCASACCALPALAGYRLDRLKQDFALEYGYQLQQALLGPGGAKVYPVVAVQQAFEAVYGYKLPLYRLGVEHFKQLLMELQAECSLSPEHRLTGGPPPNVPEVWYVTPPRPGDRAGPSLFSQLFAKRLLQGKALPLMAWEPVPCSATAAAAAAVGGAAAAGGGYGANPSALRGGFTGRGGRGGGRYGAAYAGLGTGTAAAAAAPVGGGVGGRGGPGAARVLAAVADLLRSKLATVPPAYDAGGVRNGVPVEVGYRLNSLPGDLLAAAGIHLNIEALGFRNLVQLVGALGEVATIVFSPDRQHRVFPPKPAAAGAAGVGVAGGGMMGGAAGGLMGIGGTALVAAGGTMGGAATGGGMLQQPPPPPRPAAGVAGAGGIPGLGLGSAAGGGPLGVGLQGAAAAGRAVAGVGGSGEMGGSLGLGTALGFNPMMQQQQQTPQQQLQMLLQLQQLQQQQQQQQLLQQQQQQQNAKLQQSLQAYGAAYGAQQQPQQQQQQQQQQPQPQQQAGAYPYNPYQQYYGR
ncbi:hypothetical protein OEZ86_007724 [Tetradesmus obliquus]|nr:hypothetical protein OEZ86_007724 [Tetradesmus obliquus]